MRPRVAAVVESCWHRVPGGTATGAVRTIHAARALDRHRLIGLTACHSGPPVLAVTAIGDALVSVRDEPERWAMLGEAARVRAQGCSGAATGERVAGIYDEVAA